MEDPCLRSPDSDSTKTVDAARNHSNEHQRINDILLGKLERKFLHWICPLMPAWTSPELLTLIAFLAGIAVAAGYALTNLSKDYVWICNLGLVLHWFGDSMDGSLARYRKIVTLYGYVMDHSLDTFVVVLIAIGIGFSPYIRLEFALFALIAYLMMAVSVNIRTVVTGVFQISYGKLGPTELRLLLIIANTVFYFAPNPVIGYWHGPIRVPDIIAAAITVFLIPAFIITTLQTAFGLRRSENADRK